MTEPTAERVPQEMMLNLQLQRERVARLQAEQRAARAEHDLAEGARQTALQEAARIEQQMALAFGMTKGDGLKEDGTIVREPRPQPPAPPPSPKDNGKATPPEPAAEPAGEPAADAS